jgi:hypothetical protein
MLAGVHGMRLKKMLGCKRAQNMNDFIIYVFREFILKESPLFIVCIGGIVAAIFLRRQASRASLYVALACGLKLLFLIMFPMIWWYVRAFNISMNPIVSIILTFVWNAGDAISIVLLVLAAYVGRKQPNT